MVDVSILIMQFYLSSPYSVAKRFDDIFESKMERLDKRTKDYKKFLASTNKLKKNKSTAKKAALKPKSKLPKTKFRKVALKK